MNKIWDLKASQCWKIVVGTAVCDNVVAAAAVDKGGVAVDIVVDVLYALHRVLSLLRLADPPLFSLLGHENKKLAISLIIIIYWEKTSLNNSVGDPYQHHFGKSDTVRE
jgi:hypothetical protein